MNAATKELLNYGVLGAIVVVVVTLIIYFVPSIKSWIKEHASLASACRVEMTAAAKTHAAAIVECTKTQNQTNKLIGQVHRLSVERDADTEKTLTALGSRIEETDKKVDNLARIIEKKDAS